MGETGIRAWQNLMSDQTLLHATCVALDVEGQWRGVLLTGPSGAGKSDLALRLVDGGARLVADDQTALVRHGDELIATAPASIGGLVEARGIGILHLQQRHCLSRVPVAAMVELVADDTCERLPDPDRTALLGVDLPRWQSAAFEASAPAKIRLGLGAILARGGKSDIGATRPAAEPGPVEAGATPAPVTGPRPVILVTGLSGAGRSAALKGLEDLGWVAVDNLPFALFDSLFRPGQETDRYAVAFGVDVRTWGFDAGTALTRLEELRRRDDLSVRLIYLDCDTDVLLRRYTESRRPHPLAQDRPIQDAIADERRLLAPLRDAADVTVDTSALSPHDLKHLIGGHFALSPVPRLRLTVMSFSFRRGLPREADLVFDARFLRNPHYVAALRPLTGLDAPVRDYIAADPAWPGFAHSLEAFLAPLLPRFDAEGKTYLTIAIGCTGGRHRSVAAADDLARRLRAQGREVSLIHRDTQPSAVSPDNVRAAAVAPATAAALPEKIG